MHISIKSINGFAIAPSCKITRSVKIKTIESISKKFSMRIKTKNKDLVMEYMYPIQIHWSID
jgi:hypothetical protein